MDTQKLSLIALPKESDQAKKQLALESYLDIHPEWKAVTETCEPHMDENTVSLKKNSEKETQTAAEEKIRGASDVSAGANLDFASDQDEDEIDTHSPTWVDEIWALYKHRLTLRDYDELEEEMEKPIVGYEGELRSSQSDPKNFMNENAKDSTQKVKCCDYNNHVASGVQSDHLDGTTTSAANTSFKYDGSDTEDDESSGSDDDEVAVNVKREEGEWKLKTFVARKTGAVQSAARAAPARIGLSHVPGQRVTQSAQKVSPTGKERLHLVVVEKDATIKVQEAGWSDSHTTKFASPKTSHEMGPARQAAATGRQSSPDVDTVSSDHHAAAVRFPLGNGWAMYSYPDNTSAIKIQEVGHGDSHKTKFAGLNTTQEAVRFPPGYGRARYSYSDNTRQVRRNGDVFQSAALGPPPRTGPDNAPDQQRCITQSAQHVPPAGSERCHLLVVEKDFTITIGEAGWIDQSEIKLIEADDQNTTQGEAAELDGEPSPSVKTVNLDNDSAGVGGHLRRGWARFSAAVRRVFDRCTDVARQRWD